LEVLAKKVGVSKMTLQRIETGSTSPSIIILIDGKAVVRVGMRPKQRLIMTRKPASLRMPVMAIYISISSAKCRTKNFVALFSRPIRNRSLIVISLLLVQKIDKKYFQYFATIECFRLNI